jgi:hypothetical protein
MSLSAYAALDILLSAAYAGSDGAKRYITLYKVECDI